MNQKTIRNPTRYQKRKHVAVGMLSLEEGLKFSASPPAACSRALRGFWSAALPGAGKPSTGRFPFPPFESPEQSKKKTCLNRHVFFLAEGLGFEPRVPLGTRHFECRTIDHSDNPPYHVTARSLLYTNSGTYCNVFSKIYCHC